MLFSESHQHRPTWWHGNRGLLAERRELTEDDAIGMVRGFLTPPLSPPPRCRVAQSKAIGVWTVTRSYQIPQSEHFDLVWNCRRRLGKPNRFVSPETDKLFPFQSHN